MSTTIVNYNFRQVHRQESTQLKVELVYEAVGIDIQSRTNYALYLVDAEYEKPVAIIRSIAGTIDLQDKIPYVPSDGIHHLELYKLIDDTEIILYRASDGLQNQQLPEVRAQPTNAATTTNTEVIDVVTDFEITYAFELNQLRVTHNISAEEVDSAQLLHLLHTNGGSVDDVMAIIRLRRVGSRDNLTA
mmetsp:Transcript_20397/g.28057  ORF Transcript_20397/g.28057 Transcript_20397/m.28057 type:complete len:189 (+) Transcript_20397:40-606(+)